MVSTVLSPPSVGNFRTAFSLEHRAPFTLPPGRRPGRYALPGPCGLPEGPRRAPVGCLSRGPAQRLAASPRPRCCSGGRGDGHALPLCLPRRELAMERAEAPASRSVDPSTGTLTGLSVSLRPGTGPGVSLPADRSSAAPGFPTYPFRPTPLHGFTRSRRAALPRAIPPCGAFPTRCPFCAGPVSTSALFRPSVHCRFGFCSVLTPRMWKTSNNARSAYVGISLAVGTKKAAPPPERGGAVDLFFSFPRAPRVELGPASGALPCQWHAVPATPFRWGQVAGAMPAGCGPRDPMRAPPPSAAPVEPPCDGPGESQHDCNCDPVRHHHSANSSITGTAPSRESITRRPRRGTR